MTVDVRKTGHIQIITLDRPDQLNAIDPDTRRALAEAWQQFRSDDDAWVAILTGRGEKAFCVGADLKKTMPPEGSFAATHFSSAGGDELWRPMRNLWKPVIAAINGFAFGGGLELALACDLRIASTNAVFSQSEVRVGSMVGAGGAIRLMKAVPEAVAMKMLLTGTRIGAEEAHRVGLISDLFKPADLMARAEEMAEEICRNAPLSVRATKMAAVLGQAIPQDQALEVERLLWGLLRNTDDRIEGRVAFAEKRQPQWRSR
ncbi:enoyl-CoA hydratase/isomerase family protein [Microvirga antarctica]|uniref:enoyl-CoA hydratase/isomerase family protein n=1 Tax=Microvirga antarctica TaxID=2819233 RepID=UPI001B311788